MRLYSGPLSLFSRKVEIALREKGLDFERVAVPFTQSGGYSPKHPDVLAASPKGQVLVDGDLALHDSTVILEYLEDAYPEPPLYPAAPAERARCRMLELFADEVLLAPVRALMHRTGPRPADPARRAAREAAAREAEPAIAAHLAGLDRRLAGRPYLCGAAFGAADIAVFATVLYAHRLGGPPPGDRPDLAAWYARVGARPAVAAVAAEIRAADRELSTPVEGAYRVGAADGQAAARPTEAPPST